MIHTDRHDPIIDWHRCLVCGQALSAAFAHVADMDLGPHDAGQLIDAIRREANKAIAFGAAS